MTDTSLVRTLRDNASSLVRESHQPNEITNSLRIGVIISLREAAGEIERLQKEIKLSDKQIAKTNGHNKRLQKVVDAAVEWRNRPLEPVGTDADQEKDNLLCDSIDEYGRSK